MPVGHGDAQDGVLRRGLHVRRAVRVVGLLLLRRRLAAPVRAQPRDRRVECALRVLRAGGVWRGAALLVLRAHFEGLG